MTSRLRAPALIAAAALALHQLRYLLAGGHAEPAAGHSYLPFAGLAVVAVLALAAGQLVRVLAGRADGGPASTPRFRALWLLAAVAVFAVFAGQELLEGFLSTGRPDGSAAVFAGGGWVALPLAVVFGGLVAAGLAGAGAVIRAAARRLTADGRRRRVARRPVLPRAHRPARSAAASPLAGRAPPLPC